MNLACSQTVYNAVMENVWSAGIVDLSGMPPQDNVSMLASAILVRMVEHAQLLTALSIVSVRWAGLVQTVQPVLQASPWSILNAVSMI